MPESNDVPNELSFMRPLEPRNTDETDAEAEAEAEQHDDEDTPKLSRAERRGKAAKTTGHGKLTNAPRFPAPPSQRNFSTRRSG